jgi:hypothetical protein
MEKLYTHQKYKLFVLAYLDLIVPPPKKTTPDKCVKKQYIEPHPEWPPNEEDIDENFSGGAIYKILYKRNKHIYFVL